MREADGSRAAIGLDGVGATSAGLARGGIGSSSAAGATVNPSHSVHSGSAEATTRAGRAGAAVNAAKKSAQHTGVASRVARVVGAGDVETAGADGGMTPSTAGVMAGELSIQSPYVTKKQMLAVSFLPSWMCEQKQCSG